MAISWPAFESDDAWSATYPVLHMWTQVIGKVKLALAAPENHWWHSTLHVTTRGLTTGPVPYDGTTFELELDFQEHRLTGRCHDGARAELSLPGLSVAEFHRSTLDLLGDLGVTVRIWPVPVEIPDAVPFADDHRTGYDPDAARRWWLATVAVDQVLRTFRGEYLGKSSPVHFFWGAFDLAVTRFSGRPAPRHPGGVPGVGDWVMHEAYSHEASSAGFWPGTADGSVPPSLYAYAYPEPDGYRDVPMPDGVRFDPVLGELLLPYEVVQRSTDPPAAALAFFRAAHSAATCSGHWDRELERSTFPGRPG
ncbi:MAG: hypothetical protein JWN67_202 [Actinomycetia bacterium]|nr:hypothetical protein [Actinomycetes bacterium]